MINEKEKSIELEKTKREPTQKQKEIIKFQYEAIRKTYLARLISPIFAQKSTYNANIAATLGQNWENISKSFSNWIQEHKIKTPILKKQEQSKKNWQNDILAICAIPGYYEHKDLDNYIQRSKELSYQFNNVILIGNQKNTVFKKIIEHFEKNNIKTRIINPIDISKNINHPKYKNIIKEWQNGNLKFFGTNQSIQRIREHFKSAENKTKENEKILA